MSSTSSLLISISSISTACNAAPRVQWHGHWHAR